MSVCAGFLLIMLVLAVQFAERIGVGDSLNTAEESCCVKSVGGL